MQAWAPLRSPMDELTFEQWTAVVNVNLTGAFLCAQHAMRLMRNAKSSVEAASLSITGRISATTPRPNSAPYTANSKHAITGLTKRHFARWPGVRYCVWAISTSATPKREMTQRMASGILQANGTMMVEPRMDVKHVADAVVYMASLPLDANVQFMTVMATKMPLVGRG